jgi:C4-dicarboxylate transporter
MLLYKIYKLMSQQLNEKKKKAFKKSIFYAVDMVPIIIIVTSFASFCSKINNRFRIFQH